MADDSLTIQKVIELTFSGTEFELRAVGNGDLALPLLDSYAPDIVLVDCVMPGKTGYELCEEVKSRPGGRYVPVVLLTGTFEPFDKPRAERAGADSFVTKPFDSQGLASLVRDLVKKASEERAAAPPEPPPAPEPPPPPPPPATPPPPSVEERAESTDPTVSAAAPFLTLPMATTLEAEPVPDESLYATSAIPVFRETEIEMPMPPDAPAADAAAAPPPDPPTEPLGLPFTPAADYEMDLGALDDEPPHRDLDEDIAAFEASGRGTTRPEFWDSPAVKAVAEASAATASSEEHPQEHSPGDLEALAAEASLSDLKSLIPQASAAAAASGPLSDGDIDRIARRVLELAGERIVRKIAWDVVPELAERLVKERLDELERAD
ncbi:MAG TPA: response regulator [Thermoanaerobaculia bacterium]